jgi:ATP-dependent Clp protease adapter protein ClpS
LSWRPARDLGFDAVDVVVDVHAIGHGLLVVYSHDQVLVEEAEGALVGRGGEADQVGVEVLQHLRHRL